MAQGVRQWCGGQAHRHGQDLGALVQLGGPAGALPAEEGDIAADGADDGPLDLAVHARGQEVLDQAVMAEHVAAAQRPAGALQLSELLVAHGALTARAVLALALRHGRAGGQGPGCGREGLSISAFSGLVPLPASLLPLFLRDLPKSHQDPGEGMRGHFWKGSWGTDKQTSQPTPTGRRWAEAKV